jgi:hypothetical protein
MVDYAVGGTFDRQRDHEGGCPLGVRASGGTGGRVMRVFRRLPGGRRRNLQTGIEVASLCVTVLAALSIPARAVTVSETRICTTGSSSANTYTCIDVFDAGRYIDHAEASAKIVHLGRALKVCLEGPGIDRCKASRYVGPFDTLVSDWAPKTDEPAGQYKAVTYRLNNDGTYTKIGTATVQVG